MFGDLRLQTLVNLKLLKELIFFSFSLLCRSWKRYSMLLPEIPSRTQWLPRPNSSTLERGDRKPTSSPQTHHRRQSSTFQFKNGFHRFTNKTFLVLSLLRPPSASVFQLVSLSACFLFVLSYISFDLKINYSICQI